MPKFKDLKGERFGRLEVLRRAKNCGNYAMWECVCDCGRHVVVRTSNLKSGHTTSCGCYQRERARETNTKHGLSGARIYRIYQHMINRCYNSKESGYENYGGRGIRVCNEWKNSFDAFSQWSYDNGYNDQMTIDRIDVNGDYCPGNCRWATYKEQANNQRSNRMLEYKGARYTMSQLADEYNIPYGRLDSRIFRGWSIADSVETPVSKLEGIRR